MGVYLVSDGSNKPYRCKIRAPGFYHLVCRHCFVILINLLKKNNSEDFLQISNFIHFWPMSPFYAPLKTTENQRFPGEFRRYKLGIWTRNWFWSKTLKMLKIIEVKVKLALDGWTVSCHIMLKRWAIIL